MTATVVSACWIRSFVAVRNRSCWSSGAGKSGVCTLSWVGLVPLADWLWHAMWLLDTGEANPAPVAIHLAGFRQDLYVGATS